MATDVTQVIKGLGGTAGKPTAANAGLDKDQVKTLAEQFESTMVSQMLKGLQTSLFDNEEEDGESSMGVGPLSDALFNELSMAITKAGGLGISKSLTGAITAQTAALDPTAQPAAATNSAPTSLTPVEPSLQPLTPSALPLSSRVSSAYGMRRDPISGESKMHKGSDIPMPVGSKVSTAGSGTVVSVGEVSGYGLEVVVDHGNGVTTRYAHLSSASVKPGDAVAKGQVIALSGNSGRSTGPHLHFEVMAQGAAIDPQGAQAAALLSH